MPNYDYRCNSCGHKFELFQSMSDAKLTECPRCGGDVERLIGAGAGLIFKGSGFYITDYRSDSYKRDKRAESSTSTSASSSSDSGSKKSDKKTGKDEKSSGTAGTKKKEKKPQG